MEVRKKMQAKDIAILLVVVCLVAISVSTIDHIFSSDFEKLDEYKAKIKQLEAKNDSLKLEITRISKVDSLKTLKFTFFVTTIGFIFTFTLHPFPHSHSHSH